jgi:hypothetical protein
MNTKINVTVDALNLKVGIGPLRRHDAPRCRKGAARPEAASCFTSAQAVFCPHFVWEEGTAC